MEEPRVHRPAKPKMLVNASQGLISGKCKKTKKTTGKREEKREKQGGGEDW